LLSPRPAAFNGTVRPDGSADDPGIYFLPARHWPQPALRRGRTDVGRQWRVVWRRRLRRGDWGERPIVLILAGPSRRRHGRRPGGLPCGIDRAARPRTLFSDRN